MPGGGTMSVIPPPPQTGDRLKWVPYENEYPDLVWDYTHLNEPDLTAKFEQMATWGTIADTDYATIQPCTNPMESSQDRHLVQDWEIDGQRWRFRGIFDGHGGHETVDHTLDTLPSFLLSRLAQRIRAAPQWTESDVAKVLSDTIIEFDERIARDFLALVPGKTIYEASDAELQHIVNAPENIPAVLRCMRGTTVLIALVDPEGANLWVASLGDCTAILGTREPGGTWATQTLSFNHNGQNPAEAARVSLEHAGEQGCIEDDRVLGAIAVTRALGDFVFKFPAIYTRRGLLNCDAGFRTQRKVEELLPRVITPPYVSNIPQINHVALRHPPPPPPPSSSSVPQSSSSNGTNGRETPRNPSKDRPVLLLYSDGLGDLYEDEFQSAMKIPGFWSSVFGKVVDELPAAADPQSGDIVPQSERNVAMRFVRQGLGGDDEESVSRSLMTECGGRWMDDTSVLFVRL